MNFRHCPPRPDAPGVWFPIPAAARVYGVDESTIRRWVTADRLRSKKREGRKGMLVWSEDVAELVGLQYATPKKRLPRLRRSA